MKVALNTITVWTMHVFSFIMYYWHTLERGCDRMVVRFTTTYAISAYHHWCCEFESRSGWQLCDKVCQWLATGRWFSPGPLGSSTNKTDRHDITEVLLKVAINTIKQTNIPERVKIIPANCSIVTGSWNIR